MPNCAVKLCGSDSRFNNFKKDSITFHRFPLDAERKEIWISRTMRNKDWFPTSNSTICSKHFTPDCFVEMKGRRKLVETSLPTLYLPKLFTSPQTASEKDVTIKNMESIQSSSKTTTQSPSQNEDPENSIQVVMVDDSNANNSRSGSPISEDLVSDTDSIFDTPIVATLKAQLKSSLENNKKCSYRIHALQKRSKYYKNKTTALRAVVKQLRNKIEVFKKIITKLSENAKRARRDSY